MCISMYTHSAFCGEAACPSAAPQQRLERAFPLLQRPAPGPAPSPALRPHGPQRLLLQTQSSGLWGHERLPGPTALSALGVDAFARSASSLGSGTGRFSGFLQARLQSARTGASHFWNGIHHIRSLVKCWTCQHCQKKIEFCGKLEDNLTLLGIENQNGSG